MAHLIDKDAIVSEIESKFQKYWEKGEESDALQDGNAKYWGGVLSCLNEVKTLINTLEVKEVDFDAEWKRYFEYRGDMATVNVKHLVKYFFELGLKAQKGE